MQHKRDTDFFYHFEYLAQLFVGHCVKIDGEVFCPHESVHVSDLDQAELAQQRCSIFDDVVACQHDIREALQGGSCLLAGQTYVCEDDIPLILEHKCIDIKYEGLSLEDEVTVYDKHVCGRELIDFLNGYPLDVSLPHSAERQLLRVVTGNDLTMLTAKCLLLEGYQLCWENQPVARPFDFIDNRCSVDTLDSTVKCLGPRAS